MNAARAVCVAAVVVAGAMPSALAAQGGATRDVLVVSNNWAGTADLIDPHTFKRLDRINVIPDAQQRVAEINADPTRKFYFDSIRNLVGEGHDQYVDDGFTSPDGTLAALQTSLQVPVVSLTNSLSSGSVLL